MYNILKTSLFCILALKEAAFVYFFVVSTQYHEWPMKLTMIKSIDSLLKNEKPIYSYSITWPLQLFFFLCFMDARLLLVTRSGSVNDLYSLIQSEPHILENVDVVPFMYTPLHEAASTGKLDLAMELMILKPSFAKKLNTDGFSPLHVAVESQQVELALELVKFDPRLVRFPGRGGMTALHLVAKNGNADLLTEFLEACPESIRDLNVNGETALHITVINNRYKELKALTRWMQKRRSRDALSTEIYVLDRPNRQGNTALHLAAYENNHKVVQQLLKCMSLDRNILNKHGMTALEVLQANGSHMNKDTEKIMKKSGGKTRDSLISKVKTKSDSQKITFWTYYSTGLTRYRSNVSEGARNALLVITALIITATYQTAVQPEDKNNKKHGEDIFYEIVLLWGFNTIAFILSIVLTFILLPAGRAYTWWYIVIIVPLFCSYAVAAFRNKYSIFRFYRTSYFFITLYVMAILGFLVFLLVFYVRWKRRRPMKILKPKPEQNLRGSRPWFRH